MAFLASHNFCFLLWSSPDHFFSLGVVFWNFCYFSNDQHIPLIQDISFHIQRDLSCDVDSSGCLPSVPYYTATFEFFLPQWRYVCHICSYPPRWMSHVPSYSMDADCGSGSPLIVIHRGYWRWRFNKCWGIFNPKKTSLEILLPLINKLEDTYGQCYRWTAISGYL